MFKNSKPSGLTLLLVVILLIAVGLFFWVSRQLSVRPDLGETKFGITFSSLYTTQLGLNVKETYQALVDELGVRTVRLPVYWSQIEQESGRFDWEEMDWLVDYSKEHEVALTLVVGAKVPRWPECFIPDWAEKLSSADRQKAVLSFLETTVNRYKTVSVVERWQVENEPFFPFGECPKLSPKQFLERVDLVVT